MQLVTISGPHAAGKEQTVLRLMEAFSEHPLSRVVPCTSRKRRENERHGREYYFISPPAFARLVARKEFVYLVQIREHYSGTLRSELLRHERAVIDITPEGARQLRDVVAKEGGSAFCVFLHAPEHHRRRRIRERQPSISHEELQAMLRQDPVDPDPLQYPDFDLVIENQDGKLEEVAQNIAFQVGKFLTLEPVFCRP